KAVDELPITDLYGNAVKIVQLPSEPRQFIYIHQCKPHFECKQCNGVSSKSQCVMRHTKMRLHHVCNGCDNSKPVFDIVQVPSHCACELIAEHHNNEICEPVHPYFLGLQTQ
ncbi:unnamed protein product, partial [Meganyctiphanes norvegica]